jgi:hypothetical protein
MSIAVQEQKNQIIEFALKRWERRVTMRPGYTRTPDRALSSLFQSDSVLHVVLRDMTGTVGIFDAAAHCFII